MILHYLLINQVWGIINIISPFKKCENESTLSMQAMKKQFPPNHTGPAYIYILIILHIYLLFIWHFTAYKVISYSWFNLIFTTILSLFHTILDQHGVAIKNISCKSRLPGFEYYSITFWQCVSIFFLPGNWNINEPYKSSTSWFSDFSIILYHFNYIKSMILLIYLFYDEFIQ